MAEEDQPRRSLDELAVTLISVLVGVGLSAFSVARSYVAWWIALCVAVGFVGGLMVAIKLWSHKGWLQSLGRWLLR